MKEYDFVIIGGGCAGLSLAYELDTHNKLNDKTLAIVETREEYKRDKTWSFWKVNEHNFNDCIKKTWKQFSIKTNLETKVIKCDQFPYESIDSGLFYDKINKRLKKNCLKTMFWHLSTIFWDSRPVHLSKYTDFCVEFEFPDENSQILRPEEKILNFHDPWVGTDTPGPGEAVFAIRFNGKP